MKNMDLSHNQLDALEHAQEHGGKLLRWKKQGYWTYENAMEEEIDSDQKSSLPEWYCRTTTIFALVRRGYMKMDNWESCTLINDKTNLDAI
ncbi:hypothetical protein [Paenibacillus sp. KN14-4R]|uniref:hypothetical protein n=1 Tax=Paenibacillus sp. KN14-4R TaxID=3445773 RepID=UPI003F9FDEE3